MINFKSHQTETGPAVFNHILSIQGYVLASTVNSDLVVYKKDKASLVHFKTMPKLSRDPIVAMASTIDKSYAIVIDEQSFVLLYPAEGFRSVHRASLPEGFYPKSVVCSPVSKHFIVQGRHSLLVFSFDNLKEPVLLNEVVGDHSFITSTVFKENLILVADDSGTITALDLFRIDQGIDEATVSVVCVSGAIQELKVQGEWLYAFSSTWDIVVFKFEGEDINAVNTLLNVRPTFNDGAELSQPISCLIQRGTIQILACSSAGVLVASLYKLKGSDITPLDVAIMDGSRAFVCDAVASSIALDSKCVIYSSEYEKSILNVYVRQ